MHSTFRIPLASTLVLFAACSTESTDGGGDDGDSGTIRGRITFVEDPAAFLAEVEPNDGVDEPQPAGDLVPGRTLRIRGALEAGDTFDGFAFVARERCRIQADLRLLDAPGARFQLAAFDPLALEIVAGPAGDAGIALQPRGPFDLVVRAAEGAGAYELTVRALLPVELAPDWMGAFGVGDHVELALPGTFRFTAAEALTLRVAARDGEVVVRYDEGQLLAAVPAGQSKDVTLPPLARFVVECSAGSSAWVGALDARVAVNAARAPRSAARELQAWAAPLGRAYGRDLETIRAGEILAKARAGADLRDDLGRRGLAEVDRIGEEILQLGFDVSAIPVLGERRRTTLALIRSLGASPRVEYAEPNRIRRAFGLGLPPFTPDDQHFGLQWHYPLIRLPEAWAEVQAFVTAPGDPVIVAVIDTGRRTHPDLDGNVLAAGFEFDFISDGDVAQDGDGPDPVAFDTGDGEGIVPSSFHGTHVAGTIAALTDSDNTSASLGVAGVASIPVGTPGATSRVKVVHLRVLGQGGGTDADIARAIRYAAGLSNPGITPPAEPFDVINMSLGGPGGSQTVQDAVTRARNRGVTLFAAAGNEDSNEPSFPAAFDDVVSVAAVDRNAARASYSNFHPTVDLCAPGGDVTVDSDDDGFVDGVLSTLVDEDGGAPIFVFYQGTSMACPHAAGPAALMKVVAPALTPPEIESKLFQTATDLGSAGRDVFHGEGLIDALLAVQSAGTGGSGVPLLALSPPALDFGEQETELALTILNLGAGAIDVQTVLADVPWIAIDLGPAGAGIDVGSATVSVDRGHPDLAADGTYLAAITVTTDAGVATSAVTVVVDTTKPPDLPILVLAVPVIDGQLGLDDEGFLIVEGLDVVNPADVLDFELRDVDPDGAEVPGGVYVVFASTDIDDDGVLCEDEDWCGFYPTFDELELVVVDGDVEGVDFAVQPGQLEPALAVTQGGADRPARRALRLRRR